jgi:polar amino acid transport system substrate-binding protein
VWCRPGYAEGVAAVAQGKADAFFADRVVLQNQVALNYAAGELQVLDRLFDLEPFVLVWRVAMTTSACW